MKKLLISLAVVLGSLFTFYGPQAVLAVDPLQPACNQAGGTDFCSNKAEENNRTLVDSEDSLMMRIAQTIILITAALSVIMVVFGGLRYVISNGDQNGVQNAKNTILYAIVGLVVAATAQIIVSFVLTRFI